MGTEIEKLKLKISEDKLKSIAMNQLTQQCAELCRSEDNKISELEGDVGTLHKAHNVYQSTSAVPVLYEKYEDQVDAFVEKFVHEIKKQYAVFDAKCKNELEQIVIPVFHDVSPSDVFHQNPPFAKSFAKHEKKYRDDMEKVQRWRDVFAEAGKISGYHLQNINLWWLEWPDYPSSSLPEGFDPSRLVGLCLYRSHLVELWPIQKPSDAASGPISPIDARRSRDDNDPNDIL
ncbi:Reticulon-like protein B4 [Capsicum baccatum]|uniref:Reticulon-like protein B4 n=1 Tax=Capsicum baccatum TaxID=33114 RepID=A0A2G2VTA2_CAPBA|nr:Reticulon-like protein B4 [Capsicum baccatum]